MNKIIRGQAKCIETIGADATQILSKCPDEAEDPQLKIPKQMLVCTELNSMNKELVNNLKKESQKTLCLLTSDPDLNHNLFELEQDKRDLFKKKDHDHKVEVDKLHDDIKQLKVEFNRQIKALEDDVKKKEGIIEEKDNRIKQL